MAAGTTTMCQQVQQSPWPNGAPWLQRFLCCNLYQPSNRKPVAAHETLRFPRLARDGRIVGACHHHPFRGDTDTSTVDRWCVTIGADHRNGSD